MKAYFDKLNKPLKTCPFCSEDLTKKGGIAICLILDEFPWTIFGQLDEWGNLLDMNGNDGMCRGIHSHTSCGYCGKKLVKSSDVIESQLP